MYTFEITTCSVFPPPTSWPSTFAQDRALDLKNNRVSSAAHRQQTEWLLTSVWGPFCLRENLPFITACADLYFRFLLPLGTNNPGQFLLLSWRKRKREKKICKYRPLNKSWAHGGCFDCPHNSSGTSVLCLLSTSFSKVSQAVKILSI